MPEKNYPAVITREMLPEWAAHSDAEVQQDIDDTEREIEQLRQMREAEETLARVHIDHTQRQLYDFKAGARSAEIRAREAFIAFLRRLQVARAVASVSV